MRRLLLILTTILIFPLGISAQRIFGYVADNEGVLLPGASVILGGSSQATASNHEGAFSIKAKPGKCRIVISYVGFENHDETIIIEDGDYNMGTIKLTPLVIMADEVIVEATRPQEKTPMTSNTVDDKYLNSRNIVQDIPTMLNLTPSLVATSEGGYGVGATALRIRGTDASRINITLNNIPLNDAESQSVFWSNMPDIASSVNSITITRGVGGSTNGSSSFGASINILTGRKTAKPYAELNLMGGSFNTFKADILAGTGVMKSGFSFDIRLSKLNSDGYIENGFSDHKSVMLTATWRQKSAIWKANVLYGKQRTGITWWGCPQEYLETNRTYNPAGEYFDDDGNRKYYQDESDNYTQTHIQLSYTNIISEKLNFNVGLNYTRGDGYYEEYKIDKKFSEYGLPNIMIPVVYTTSDTTYTTYYNITNTDAIHRKIMANNMFCGIISANYRYNKLAISCGASYNKYLGNHFGNIIWLEYSEGTDKDYEWYRNKSDKNDFNVFVKAEYSLFKNFAIYGDLQYRSITYKLKGQDSDIMPSGLMKVLNEDLDYGFFNPKVGFFYNITDKMNVYFSTAVAHREPTRANIKDAAGDPLNTPQPERLTDFELGYKYGNRIFAGNLNLYYMKYKDQLVPTGEKSSSGFDIMTNVADSYRMGMEVCASVKPVKRLTIDGNVTWSKNKIKEFVFWATTYDDKGEYLQCYTKTNTDLAYSPSVIAAGTITYNIFASFNISFVTKYVGKQYFDNTSSQERMLKGYCVNNLNIDYTIITKHINEIKIKFQVNNLFNIKYCSDAYGGSWYEYGIEKTWAYLFPQAGINFMGGVTLSF